MILLRRRYPLRYEQKVRYIQWYLSKLNPLGLAFVFGIWKYLVYTGLIDKDFLHWYIQDSGLFRVPFRQAEVYGTTLTSIKQTTVYCEHKSSSPMEVRLSQVSLHPFDFLFKPSKDIIRLTFVFGIWKYLVYTG
jgi:hypothetical protein